MEQSIDLEKYFRPSKLPALNDINFSNSFLDNYYGNEPSEVSLSGYLFKTQRDTIINYFSLLREAANPVEGKSAGCGTIGNAKLPYKVSYNFLSSSYQERLPYDQFLKKFENILHINLIKLKKVPVYEEHSNNIRYFVEIETIEGSDKGVAYFAYYYGFIDIICENGKYKISDSVLYPENYLCAPYHGWAYMAESVVDIKYGDWCLLVKERYKTQQDDYIKLIFFKGTDGHDYAIEFYQLTNGTDIEISQYIKSENGNWKLLLLDADECLQIKY